MGLVYALNLACQAYLDLQRSSTQHGVTDMFVAMHCAQPLIKDLHTHLTIVIFDKQGAVLQHTIGNK